jgi:hypothetical protein
LYHNIENSKIRHSNSKVEIDKKVISKNHVNINSEQINIKECVLSFVDREADKDASANEGSSVKHEGHKVNMYDQVMECA